MRLGEVLVFRNGQSSPQRADHGKYEVHGANGLIGYCDNTNAKSGTTVIGRVGSYCGNVHFLKTNSWVTDNAILAFPENESIPRYWYFVLKFLNLGRLRQGSGQPLLNQEILRNIVFTPHSIDQQRRIAGILGLLDDKIESNTQAISLAELLILTLFSSKFNSERKTEGVALSDLININPKYMLKKGTLAEKVTMPDVPELSPVIYNHEVLPYGSGSRFSNGDVLFARISPCLENGKTAIVDFLHNNEVGFGSTEFIVLSPKNHVSTAWIYAFARDPDFREICRQAMTGSSGRQRLSADFFSKYIVDPPRQTDLVTFNKSASPLLALMTALRNENLKLSKLRDALLPELMSGRMRVDEAGRLVNEAVDEEVC